MVLDKQGHTLSDKQTFKDQAIKNDVNVMASTAKCIFITRLKIREVFKSTHSGIILEEGVKAIKTVAVIPLAK